jgi:uncharacterized protein
MIQFEKVEQFMLQKLQNELPQHLSYHSVSHVKDVMQAALNIARQEGVQQQEQILLQTAALFHDSGFLFGAQEHERKSCNIAREYLPQYGYDAQQIEQICGMIMATKIPQSPQNHLEEILADADLDYLGRDDFFTIGNRLFDELSMFGIVSTERDWNMLQLRFLESHHYFTKTAIALRSEKKQEHLNYLKNQLNTHE